MTKLLSIPEGALQAEFEKAADAEAWPSVDCFKTVKDLRALAWLWYRAGRQVSQSAIQQGEAPVAWAKELREFADAVNMLAFSMSPPNKYTPQFAMLCHSAINESYRLESAHPAPVQPVSDDEVEAACSAEKEVWERTRNGRRSMRAALESFLDNRSKT